VGGFSQQQQHTTKNSGLRHFQNVTKVKGVRENRRRDVCSNRFCPNGFFPKEFLSEGILSKGILSERILSERVLFDPVFRYKRFIPKATSRKLYVRKVHNTFTDVCRELSSFVKNGRKKLNLLILTPLPILRP
jgi:hypothetical protein